jgi:hypothetical protein
MSVSGESASRLWYRLVTRRGLETEDLVGVPRDAEVFDGGKCILAIGVSL